MNDALSGRLGRGQNLIHNWIRGSQIKNKMVHKIKHHEKQSNFSQNDRGKS